MIFLSFIVLLIGYIWLFLRQNFLLSPTSIFAAYAGLTLPASFLIAGYLEIPSVFYESIGLIDDEVAVFCIFATALGMLGLVLGRELERILPVCKPRDSTIIASRFNILLPVVILFASISFTTLIGELGGIDRVISELGAVRSGELIGKGVQVYGITMLLPTALQWYLIYTLKSRRGNGRFVLCLCIASCLLGAGFGFRAPAVALLIQTIVIWYLLTKSPSKKMMLVGMLLVIPLVTLAGFLRFLTNELVVDKLIMADSIMVAKSLSDSTLTRVRGIEAFSLLMPFVDTHEYGFFLGNIVESALAIIPSFLYQKPISLTENIATLVYGSYLYNAGVIKEIYGGVSYTFISEGYWNLGFSGVFLYGIFFGFLFKFVERTERCQYPTSVQILFYKAISGFAPLLVEATQLGINAIIVNVGVNFIVLAFISIPINKKLHRSA